MRNCAMPTVNGTKSTENHGGALSMGFCKLCYNLLARFRRFTMVRRPIWNANVCFMLENQSDMGVKFSGDHLELLLSGENQNGVFEFVVKEISHMPTLTTSRGLKI
jgi:hypothetical protein